MEYRFNPGDKVTFFARGKQMRGRIEEVTLWRRTEEIAYKIVSGKEAFWRTEDRVQP